MSSYWDYGTASSSTATTSNWWSNWSTSTGTTTNSAYTNSTVTGNYYYYTCTVRRYLIEAPAHWDEAVTASFVRLVNDETHTGFTVEMVISGEIKITDPSIERRSMHDFVPLLQQLAAGDDRKKIAAFFAEFGDQAPAT